ncbi:hypothetical protein JOC54_003951 [Alkalihalobacillus xiaoxiensis]|uniref:Uncharacterized protein n=1 Tax=Shouchella xiaoxiensis TaxID=766895 RepID=A0ABS2SYQ6_9BACI|nr:hypothetical protein [Shouchella xiaoxiensis]MBM7840658.1 hypothetical protein [Shouchella xiaoxiensis]
MKQPFRILLLILFSLIPFGFLAMYWDFVGRTIMGYGIWIIASLVSGFLAKRWLSWKLVFLVPLPSMLLSYVLLWLPADPYWDSFFKPFTASSALGFFSLLQLIPFSIGGYLAFRIKKADRPNNS